MFFIFIFFIGFNRNTVIFLVIQVTGRNKFCNDHLSYHLGRLPYSSFIAACFQISTLSRSGTLTNLNMIDILLQNHAIFCGASDRCP